MDGIMKRRNSSESATSRNSQLSHSSQLSQAPVHLSESYSRPVFILGARSTFLPQIFGANHAAEDILPIPQAYLTRDERSLLEEQETTLLENNDLIPNPQAALDTVMEIEEPIDQSDDRHSIRSHIPARGHHASLEEATEHSSLLPLSRQATGQSHGTYSIREGPFATLQPTEIPRAEKRRAWENAVQKNEIKTTWKYESKLLSSSSTPLIATFMLQYSMQFASIFSLGHLGRNELAAVSLASMSASITMISFTQGIATSLDTLCAQSFGANNPHLVGLHLQRCLLLLLLCLLPIGALWWSSEAIFVKLNQSSEVAYLSSMYLKLLFLGAPAYVGFESLKRFTAAQGNFRVSTYTVFLAAPINVILNYVLVWHPEYALSFRFAGAPISQAVSYWIMFITLALGVKFGRSRHSWHGFSRQAFRGWGPMIALAIPGCISCCSEWFAYEVIAFSSSQLGVVPLGAQAILSTTGSLVYQIPFAVSVGVSARVGNLLGANLSRAARTASLVGFWLSVIIGSVLGIILLMVRFDWPRLFTDDDAVVAYAARVFPLCALFNALDPLQVITAGILRGQGQQHLSGYLNIVGYYVICIPLGLYLCFGHINLGLAGLWIGMNVGIALITLAQIILAIYPRGGWDVLTENIRLRIVEAQEVARERQME